MSTSVSTNDQRDEAIPSAHSAHYPEALGRIDPHRCLWWEAFTCAHNFAKEHGSDRAQAQHSLVRSTLHLRSGAASLSKCIRELINSGTFKYFPISLYYSEAPSASCYDWHHCGGIRCGEAAVIASSLIFASAASTAAVILASRLRFSKSALVANLASLCFRGRWSRYARKTHHRVTD